MSHIDRELELIEFWKENKIFEKSVDKNAEKEYIFFDGPPFATGLPHYGHILGLTSKDVFPRYFTMKGYRVPRRWGWDCHGLPIENIAEKDLGIKNKTEISGMGVKKFNDYCRSKVLFFATEWKKTVDRMGKWIEFDNSYKTMDRDYLETIWYIFKSLYDRKLAYEGKKILMYCPRCETPLANAEIAMDNSYKDVTEKSAIAKFKLKDDNAYLLAWTTTPWTLIGNVALAINPKLTYVKIEANSEILILAKERLEEIESDYKVLDEFLGERLIGKKYEPLYELDTGGREGYYIISGGDEVTNTDGTGIVHMAIYGEFDYEMIKKHNLPLIQHVGLNGRLEAGPEEFIGKWFKDLDPKVLEDLDNRGLLYNAKDYTHSYPFCYRCDTPLMYNAVGSWFVNIQEIKDKLLENNEQINWVPERLKHGAFSDIIKTAPDWSISRNRFWATAIPVWKCDCGEVKVIGSVRELVSSAKEDIDESIDLHKDSVDNITIECPACHSDMHRIPEVFDCWFESGSMPFASRHYPFENKELVESTTPGDFVSEYIGQVRAWFYYSHVISTLMLDRAPFKNIVTTGNILAEDGSKMSKSKKNYPDPKLIFDKYGADALRFYLMSTQVMRAQDINFREEGVKEIYRKLIVILSNVKRFNLMYYSNNTQFSDSSTNIMDRWILSKYNNLNKNLTNYMGEYNTVLATREILEFVDILSTWYVRRSRDRFKIKDKDAQNTLSYVLYNLSKLIAPIVPFIAEDIYLSLKEGHKLEESVHLEAWPEFNESKIDNKLEEDMVRVRDMVSIALEERERVKIPIKQALQKVTFKSKPIPRELESVILDEINVKELEIVDSGEMSAELDTNITPELKREGIAREIIRHTNSLRKKSKLTIQDRVKISVASDSDIIKEALDEHKKNIFTSTQADGLTTEPKYTKEVTINEESVKIGIKVL